LMAAAVLERLAGHVRDRTLSPSTGT